MNKRYKFLNIVSIVLVFAFIALLSNVLIACSCSCQEQPAPTTYSVKFVDHDDTQIGVTIDGNVVYEQQIESGHAAVAPQTPTRAGYRFDSWDKEFSNVTEDLVINAVYVKQWTVTFADYDNTELKVQVVDEGSNAVAPQNPTREEYVFDHWDNQYSNVTQDLIVKATYRVATYNVRFLNYDNQPIGVNIGGEMVTVQVIEHGHSATAPQDPTRENYRFDHWEGAYTNITADIDIVAVYVRQYTVTFLDYDNTELKVEVVDEGGDATAPELPERPDFIHYGWNNVFTNVTEDLVVKAVYGLKTFNVKFLDYDNTPLGVLVDDVVCYEQNVVVGHSAVAPENPNRPGYRFDSWSRDFSEVIADMVIYAQYVQTFEVLFLDYDFSVYEVQVVDYGKNATVPVVDPTRTGYRFDHWEGNLTNILANIEINAVYIKQYTVTFVDYDNTELKVQVVDEGGDATAPILPSRDGYTFDGWSCEFTNVETDITVVATYKELTYNVSFYDYNKKLISTEKVYHGTSAQAPYLENDIQIDWDSIEKGYIFAGWDKEFNNVQEDMDIYAVYEVIQTPIIYIEPTQVEVGTTQYISVSVYVIAVTSFNALEINLSYNSNLNLTLSDIVVKNMFNVQDKYNLTLDSVDHQLSFSWISTNEVTLSNNYAEVFELRFQVDKHLPVGDYEIDILETSNYVKDFIKMTPIMLSNSITIYKEETNND